MVGGHCYQESIRTAAARHRFRARPDLTRRDALLSFAAPFSPTRTWGSRDLLFFQGQVLPRDYWSHLTLAKACWSLVSSFSRRGSQCSIDLRLFFQFVLIRLKWR